MDLRSTTTLTTSGTDDTGNATRVRAVRFDEYGPPSVLKMVDIPLPEAGAGEVVVEVRASGINLGEGEIRSGAMADRFPWPMPSVEGSALAGVVVATGADTDGFSVGDEVLGWTTNRSSHKTYTAVPVGQLLAKPRQLGWETAGALYGAGATAYAAVAAIDPQPGQTVAVSAAAGGVGSLVVQLLVRRDVRVLGIASRPTPAGSRPTASCPWPTGTG